MILKNKLQKERGDDMITVRRLHTKFSKDIWMFKSNSLQKNPLGIIT